MKKIIVPFIFVAIFIMTSGISNAFLITNGSFEEPIVTDNGGTWQLILPSDISTYGWSNADDTEIQTESLFGPAADGSQYVELDSNRFDGNNWLTQTFSTTTGQAYNLTFAFSPRQGIADNILDAGVVTYASGSPNWLMYDRLTSDGSNLSGTDWTYHTYSFIADTIEATVAFRDAGYDDSYGTFIDDVSVNPVPEPTTMLLFGTGLLGLAAFGRKKIIPKNR